MDRKQILIAMVILANELDDRGMIKEAGVIDDIRNKLNLTKKVVNDDDYDVAGNASSESYGGNPSVVLNKYMAIANGGLNTYAQGVDKELIKKILQRSDKVSLLLQYEAISANPDMGIADANRSLWKEVSKKV